MPKLSDFIGLKYAPRRALLKFTENTLLVANYHKHKGKGAVPCEEIEALARKYELMK